MIRRLEKGGRLENQGEKIFVSRGFLPVASVEQKSVNCRREPVMDGFSDPLVRQGAEIGLELDPSLSTLLPEGVSSSSSHTYPLQRRYAHGSGVILGKLEKARYVLTTNEVGFQSADLAPAGRATRQRNARGGGRTSTVGRWNGRTGASEDGGCSKGDRPPGRGYRVRIGGDGQQGARGDK
jgi:hypothetical protein